MDVSIIIINYKTHKLVEDCVQSIQKKTTHITYEVIIVDNSCDENEYQALYASLGTKTKIIKAPGNLGTCKANNLGAKNSTGDKLFFLNSDTILINDAIDQLSEFMDKEPQIGIVGGNLYSPDMKPTHSFFKREYTVKNFRKANSILSAVKGRIFKHRVDFNYSDKPMKINGFITAADMMIRRDLFLQIGGFDEHIFMYAEEPILCKEAQRQGYKMYSVPQAKIIHLEGASESKIYSDIKAHNYVFGNYYYFAKYYGKDEAEHYKKVAIQLFSRKSSLYKSISSVKSANNKKLEDALKNID